MEEIKKLGYLAPKELGGAFYPGEHNIVEGELFGAIDSGEFKLSEKDQAAYKKWLELAQSGEPPRGLDFGKEFLINYLNFRRVGTKTNKYTKGVVTCAMVPHEDRELQKYVHEGFVIYNTELAYSYDTVKEKFVHKERTQAQISRDEHAKDKLSSEMEFERNN